MEIIVIAHNIRSTHNVGAILRSCDGFGVRKFYATGYTPYPIVANDTRLPHIREKLTKHIAKTALGAETTVTTEYHEDITTLLAELRQQGYRIAALEQSDSAILLPNYRPTQNTALLLGEEVNGITPELLTLCDDILEIPMQGRKESFNVSVATGIALYALSVR